MTGPPTSAVYVGQVTHQRTGTPSHGFAYPLYMLWLDLAELEALSARLRWFGYNRRAPVSFRDADHLGDPARPVSENLRAFVESEGGRWPGGPVRLLTHARVFGYVFNPVSFFYCYAPGAAVPALVVAEVHNTYGERHCYLLDGRAEVPPLGDCDGSADVQPDEGPGLPAWRRWRVKKVFHVSPYYSLDGTYAFRLSAPSERLDVGIALAVGGETRFAARLRLARRSLTDARLVRLLCRYPLVTAQVTARIYWQALRLRAKGLPFRAKPPYDPAQAGRETVV